MDSERPGSQRDAVGTPGGMTRAIRSARKSALARTDGYSSAVVEPASQTKRPVSAGPAATPAYACALAVGKEEQWRENLRKIVPVRWSFADPSRSMNESPAVCQMVFSIQSQVRCLQVEQVGGNRWSWLRNVLRAGHRVQLPQESGVSWSGPGAACVSFPSASRSCR